MRKFVAVFRGRRDSYQVPIALNENNLLDKFVTDYYGGVDLFIDYILRLLGKNQPDTRTSDQITTGLVENSRLLFCAEHFMIKMGFPARSVYEILDKFYSIKAISKARKNKSNLFLYNPYAWEAFNAEYEHSPLKFLFQYHPHWLTEKSILERDTIISKHYNIVFEGNLESINFSPDSRRVLSDSSWRVADKIVCASSFTKNSLVSVGAAPSRIVVIPYGIDPPMIIAKSRTDVTENFLFGENKKPFNLLFVGNGLQRKGLHHLLLAWSMIQKQLNGKLIIVSRKIDQGLFPLLNVAEKVDFINGVSSSQLAELYQNSSLFVMPSLVEGFGQVYLEALSSGLPVLGTCNTCLPDLGSEEDGVFVVDPSCADSLARKIVEISLRNDMATLRVKAVMTANRFTWSRFRRVLRDAFMTDELFQS